MKTINIIFLVILSQFVFGQNSKTSNQNNQNIQKIYEGKSSLILDNKKDIIHVSNVNYKKKLIYDATINALKQACPTLINIEEFSFGDYDQADQNLKSTDRIVFNSKSGKSVQWQQVDEPVFRKDLRGENRWECTVRGYIKEVSNYVPIRRTSTIPIQKKKHDYNIGIGIGITLPQVFQANLTGSKEPLPRWDVNISPIYNIGVNFGVSKELMVGLNFAISKAKIITDLTYISSNCYGGRFQIGWFRHSVNPFISLTALYGTDKNISFAIKQAGIGIDFLKGKFKIGCEVDCLWFSSNYHVDGVQFNNDGLFTINGFKDTRFNAGINMKIYF